LQLRDGWLVSDTGNPGLERHEPAVTA
jgi:hypothetical protein